MGNHIFNINIISDLRFNLGWVAHLLSAGSGYYDNEDLGGGFKVTDQNITVVRIAFFGLSFLGVLACLYVLYVNSSVEAALKALSHSRLRGLLERQERRAKIIEQLLDQPAQVLSAVSTLNVVCLVIIPALIISAMHQFNFYGIEVPITIILALLIMLVVGRTVPRGYASQRPETVALRWSKFVNAEMVVIKPVVSLTNALSNIILRRMGVAPLPANTVVTQEELALLVAEGEEEGIIHREEREMIRSIFEFGDTVAREVMVPRLDIKSIPQTATLDETLDIILKNGHSRLPVYAEDIDHIVGILYAKDLLRFLRAHTDNTRFELTRVLRPVYYVPISKKLDMLFQELQNRRVHIAIVIDEYGGTAGLVTIEDLLEEIVGEIQDEYDTEQPQVIWRNNGEVEVDARLNLHDANELFNTDWESENVDTIGGFVYDELGRIPAPGDELIVDGVRISVLTLIGNRLKKLLLARVTTPNENPTESSPVETLTETSEEQVFEAAEAEDRDGSYEPTNSATANQEIPTISQPTGPNLGESADGSNRIDENLAEPDKKKQRK